MFASHSQIICTIFGVNIYFYGVIMAMAIVAGTLISDYIGEKFYALKKETIVDLAPYLIIFGIIGARLYYCLLNFSFYLRFPTEIIAIRHGGISIHGAILGGLIGLIIFAHRKKLSIPQLGWLLLKQSDVGEISLTQKPSAVRQTSRGNSILHHNTDLFLTRVTTIFIRHFCTRVFLTY